MTTKELDAQIDRAIQRRNPDELNLLLESGVRTFDIEWALRHGPEERKVEQAYHVLNFAHSHDNLITWTQAKRLPRATCYKCRQVIRDTSLPCTRVTEPEDEFPFVHHKPECEEFEDSFIDSQTLGKILKCNFDRVGKNLYRLVIPIEYWEPYTPIITLQKKLKTSRPSQVMKNWSGRALKRALVPSLSDELDWRANHLISEDYYAL